MTQSQKELWMAADQSDEASCAFNLNTSVFLDGPLDTDVLQRALDALISRHESLRGTFAADSLSMCIAEEIHVAIEHVNLTGKSNEEQDAVLADIKHAEVATAFDLTFGPLLRAKLALLDKERAILFVSFHHLIVDGWTLDLLLKELAEFYSAFLEKRDVRLPPAFQFSQYAQWIGDAYATLEAAEADSYWLGEFERKAPTLELPLDKPRPSVRSYSAARVEQPIEGNAAQRIFDAATKQKSTFFIYAFATYVAFIHRLTGEEDIVIAVPAAGHLDVGENQLSGHCVNTLPIRVQVDGNMSFAELLAAVRKKVYAGYGHTPFTYSLLMGRVPMDRDMSRPPLASLIMTVDQESHELPFSGIESCYRLNPRAYEMFELQVSLVSESKDYIAIQCQYNTDLFERETAESRMRDFAMLIDSATADPDAAINALAMVPPEDEALIDEWNATEEVYPSGVTMHGLFEEQVEKTPDNIALEFEGLTLTYRELDQRSNRLAAWLVGQGIGPEKMVGICMERSLEMIVAMYGILKAGGAYVPFDPDYPEDRLAFMLEDTGAEVMLTHEPARSALPVADTQVLFLDTDWDTIAAYSSKRPDVEVDENTLAYTIFTSGSTGLPKGAMNEHRGICNQLYWMQDYFGTDSDETILLKTPYSFDVSLWEIFYPLSMGARIVIAPPGAHRDPEQLADLFRDHKINGTCFVPSLLSVFVNSPHAAPESLRWIITIGEALVPDLQQRFHDRLPGVQLHNLYGPTEAAVAVTYWLCDPDDGLQQIPIGRPMGNVKIHVLDGQRKPVPVGVPGELYIGGIQVGRGYLNREELTNKVFVDDPFDESPGALMYRTGDKARWTNDGVLEYLGRIDFQVKLHGLRIELGEIESVLTEHGSIDDAVAVVDEPRSGDKRLVAYYTGSAELSAAQLRAYLSDKLPAYMVPQVFMRLERFPRLTSGKVSRKELPEPVVDKKTKQVQHAAPANETERTVAKIWADFLQVDSVETDETFFDLGGSSLLALKLVGKLAEVFDTRVPVAKFFEYPTVTSFAEWIAETGAAALPAEAPDAKTTPVAEEEEEPLEPGNSVPGDGDIAIVGMAGKFPMADNVDEFWRNLLDVKDCITHFEENEIDPDVDPDISGQPNYVRARGLMSDIDAFDAKFFSVRPREAQIMDPQQRIFIETCWHALEDAAYDVSEFDGRIGVFAGTGDNTYLWHYVLRDREAIAALGEHQTHILNERDYLTTRVAYKLDLRGPAVAIGTACSTSLVATSYAVESLRAGKCEAAIAGGIYVPAPDHSGYLYQEGGIGSADGACRPFDKDADGTVFSSGTAAVVLRPLQDAIDAGDRIYAVIKGTATNNDGADKMSFMAPSAAGQRAVIQDAVADAGVDAAEIGYVEAHGTATPIGDPIEFSALSSALGQGSGKKRWLGAVKSNLGHLDAAAGVTGLIKTAKALQTGTIPGTVNFKTPNPELDITDTGFSVTSQNVNWRESRDSMLAGVSSFGIGGTNAHVVLQSYDVSVDPKPARDQELFLFSADAPSQLGALATNLADHIDNRGTEIVSDAAYTMARGRKRLSSRAAIALSTVDATSSLRELADNPESVTPLNNPTIGFMFPGQGSQHIGMGSGLYENSRVFGDLFDQGAETLRPMLNIDLRELMFESSQDNEIASRQLTKTHLAQPALYVLQYALARHWMSWGIDPSVVFGHSIGEYAAATVAGIMSYETGLELVTARGRLVGEQPEGSMLSVRAKPEIVNRYLSEVVELAAVNSPELCVVSGPDDAIRALTEGLEADGIAASTLHTSHAFHSSMMEPARKEFRSVVAKHPLSAPNRKIISTLTGQVMSDDEATDPDYWARQLRYGVRFSDAVKTCWAESKPVLLEVGPRHTATTLARQHIQNRNKERAFSSLDGSSTPAEEWTGVLQAAGRLWTSGAELDWATIYESADRRIVSLPGYPFRRNRYWMGRQIEEVDAEQESTAAVVIEDSVVAKISDMIRQGSGISILSSDVHRDLLDIGLDSLYLTQFAIQLQKEFGVPVGLREIIESYSSVAELADFVRGDSGESGRLAAANESVVPAPQMQPFYFGRHDDLMGFYHPAAENDKKHGVLIVGPLLNEYMRAYASLRQVADGLVEDGYSVMRFDFGGMGNSLSDLQSVSLKRWEQDIIDAADELVELSGCEKLSVVGVRFASALLAPLGEHRSLESVTLWDPIMDGHVWFTKLKQVQVEHLSRFDKSLSDADTEFHGYVTPESFAEDLQVYSSVAPAASHYSVVLSDRQDVPESVPVSDGECVNLPFECEWGAVTSEVLYPREIIEAVRRAVK
jgi:amino acid adenylation domain-containing protein